MSRARERFELRFARRMTSLPPRVVRRLAGPPIVVDGQELNPQLQLILRMRELVGSIGATAETPERSRERLLRETRTFAGLPEVGGPVRELGIPGPAGSLPARHYDPGLNSSPPTRPLLVYFHGGGHVVGTLDTHDQPCRILCRHAGVHVLSVEYRKAPEDPFPAAADDALAAFEWACAHAAELGADPERIAVGGDSAGGNLAAVVAGLATPRPALQLLIYPGLERATRRASMDHFAEGYFLTEKDIDWFFGHYAGAEPAVDDPRLNALAHDDLAHLPPTIVITAGFDPLRDEGEWYADELRAAGVPVLVRRFEDLSHGIVNMTGVSSACYDAVVEMAGMMRAALDLPVGAGVLSSDAV